MVCKVFACLTHAMMEPVILWRTLGAFVSLRIVGTLLPYVVLSRLLGIERCPDIYLYVQARLEDGSVMILG